MAARTVQTLMFRVDDQLRRLGQLDERERAGFESLRPLIHGLGAYVEEDHEAKTVIQAFERANLKDKAEARRKDIDAKRSALEKRVNEALAAKDRLREDMVATEERALAGVEKVGSGWVVAKRQPTTPEQAAARREIRDVTRPLPRPEVQRRYLDAVNGGADLEFAAAMEEAPASIALLDDRTRAQARALRISQSPLAAAIERQKVILGAHELLTDAIRREAAGLGVVLERNEPAQARAAS